MTMTEFAMVEELAFLIKDNLSCKHLVLSAEEILVNFLQDNSNLDGILELEPMSPYHRLLLHRLADIFGFAHESVGEGDERHLVFQRCSDSSIPSVLVSDILLEYDEYQSPTTSTQILKRKDSLSALEIALHCRLKTMRETLAFRTWNESTSELLRGCLPMLWDWPRQKVISSVKLQIRRAWGQQMS